MSNKRKSALLSACPKCGAGPGVRCLKVDGTKRTSVHRERMDARPAYQTLRALPGGFYQSDAWRRVRYGALVSAGGCCAACGARPAPGRSLHVDHIKPASRFPDLALEPSNLQVLCEECNLGKGAHDSTDWRRK